MVTRIIETRFCESGDDGQGEHGTGQGEHDTGGDGEGSSRQERTPLQCPHSASMPALHLGDKVLTNVECGSECEAVCVCDLRVSLYLCAGMQFMYGLNASIYGYILHVVGVTYLCGEDATESEQQNLN